MVELECCATLQIAIIFTVNIILFIVGIVQVAIASYILVAGSDDLGFVSDIYQGNDEAVNATLTLGVLFIIISFWACCGAIRHSKCMLWVYAVVLFFIIMGQAMTVSALAVSINYGEAIFGDMWKDLEPETIDEIEDTYECCSFNGDSTDSWLEDNENYAMCSSAAGKGFEESCWQKFETDVDENYDMVRTVAAIFLGFQILIYFSTHYVIQSIAESEGLEERPESEMTGKPMV